jgi:septum formation protein
MPQPHLILASRSPRRQQLLVEAGYVFEVRPPSETAECGVCSGENPAQLVSRLARQKAADIAPSVTSGVILACDTVVECNGQILGKPMDEGHARRILHTLRGREHRVVSGLCLWQKPHGKPRVEVDVTTLRMDLLSDEQIEEYLASGAWEGKAGAFGYQDRTGWVHVLAGSQSNVVGLPLELLHSMISQLGTGGP